MKHTHTEVECPECYEPLEYEEACSPYTPEISEEVLVCHNKECKNYNTIVYDDEYFYAKAEDEAMERFRNNGETKW